MKEIEFKLLKNFKIDILTETLKCNKDKIKNMFLKTN